MILNPVTGEARKLIRVVKGPEVVPLIEIVADGRRVRVSQKHPVATLNGVKMAKDVMTDDLILKDDGEYVPVTTVRELEIQPDQEVINFVFEGEGASWEDLMVSSNGIVTGDLTLQVLVEHQAIEGTKDDKESLGGDGTDAR